MSDVVDFMDVEYVGPSMPIPIPGTPELDNVAASPGVGSYIEVGAFVEPDPQPAMKKFIHNHPPGQYCYLCACAECRYFYGTKIPPPQVPVPQKVRPRYSYIGFVNCMRVAAARREEIRQEKIRAERQAAMNEAAEAEKAAKEQEKNDKLRHITKRRRE